MKKSVDQEQKEGITDKSKSITTTKGDKIVNVAQNLAQKAKIDIQKVVDVTKNYVELSKSFVYFFIK